MDINGTVKSLKNEYPNLHLVIEPYDGPRCRLLFEGTNKRNWKKHINWHVERGVLSIYPQKKRRSVLEGMSLASALPFIKFLRAPSPYPSFQACLQVPKNTLQYVNLCDRSSIEAKNINRQLIMVLSDESSAKTTNIPSLSVRMYGKSKLDAYNTSSLEVRLRSQSTCYAKSTRYQQVVVQMEEQSACTLAGEYIVDLDVKQTEASQLHIAADYVESFQKQEMHRFSSLNPSFL